VAYAVALTSPFAFDDRGVVVEAEAIHSLGGLLADLGRGLRPVLKVSYAFSWAFGGSPLAFHVFNLVVHLVNVDLVLRLAKAARAPSAMVPAVLFALHPIQTEAVTYVSGRSSSLSTVFMLLALLAYARGVRQRSTFYTWAAAPIAVFLATFTKETSLVMPVGFVLWDLFIERAAPATADASSQRRWRAALGRQASWWIFGAVVFTVMIAHSGYYALLYRVVGQRSFRDALVHQLAGVSYLAGRLLLLERPCIDPGLWLPPPGWSVAVGALLVLAFVARIVWAARPRRQREASTSSDIVAFGLAWFLVHTFVPYVLVSRVDVINERHAYVANAGLFLAAGELVARFRASERVRRAVPALAITLLLLLSIRRNFEYRSPITLWAATVREAPNNPRAWNNLGVVNEQAGDRATARAMYLRAVTTDPRFLPAIQNLSRVQSR
jgi:hypothetical protein